MKNIKCRVCGETRESEFSPSCARRFDYICRVCHRIRKKEYLDTHPEIREYTRKYAREYMKEWFLEHPENRKRNAAKYHTQHPERRHEQQSKYNQSHPQRHGVENTAQRHFPDAQPCSIVGCLEMGERHHPDYNKPLEILWLCRKHHKILSRKLG